ncbi:YsnF/AvaK domain-containing protein, partial [bacterium]
MDEDEARYFESGFKTGSILVTVKATERLDEALEIIVRNGGDVGNYYRSSAYRRDPSNFDTPDTSAKLDTHLDYDNDLKTRAPLADLNSELTYDQKRNLDDKDTIQLREEELNINKHNEQVGEVVINKKVVEEMKTVEVPVTREEVIIERHKVNERATDSSIIDTNQAQEIRVPVMEEQVNVNKDTFVTEEISVEKRNVQDTKVVSENLKREEAVIQNKDDLTYRSDND